MKKKFALITLVGLFLMGSYTVFSQDEADTNTSEQKTEVVEEAVVEEAVMPKYNKEASKKDEPALQGMSSPAQAAPTPVNKPVAPVVIKKESAGLFDGLIKWAKTLFAAEKVAPKVVEPVKKPESNSERRPQRGRQGQRRNNRNDNRNTNRNDKRNESRNEERGDAKTNINERNDNSKIDRS